MSRIAGSVSSAPSIDKILVGYFKKSAILITVSCIQVQSVQPHLLTKIPTVFKITRLKLYEPSYKYFVFIFITINGLLNSAFRMNFARCPVSAPSNCITNQILKILSLQKCNCANLFCSVPYDQMYRLKNALTSFISFMDDIF